MVNNVKIALVTARQRPEVNVDHDMPFLVEALKATTVEAVAIAWDAPGVDWSAFDLVVIRSPWDYSWRSEEFLRWVERTSEVTRFANDASVVRWNADKRYLRELADSGVPIIPTEFLAPGDPIDLTGRSADFVVKPAVGAGARYAARYRPDEVELAAENVRQIHHEGATAMVQPYVQAIDTAGECALVFVRNKFLHAIRKKAVLSVGLRYDERRDAHPGTEPWQPTPAALRLAEQALAAIPQRDDLLYARIDMVVDADGSPVLTELELIEPNLYLRFHPQSMPTIVDAIAWAGTSARAAREASSRSSIPAVEAGSRTVISAPILETWSKGICLR